MDLPWNAHHLSSRNGWEAKEPSSHWQLFLEDLCLLLNLSTPVSSWLSSKPARSAVLGERLEVKGKDPIGRSIFEELIIQTFRIFNNPRNF